MSNILHFTAIIFKCDSTVFILFLDLYILFLFFYQFMPYNYIFFKIIRSKVMYYMFHKTNEYHILMNILLMKLIDNINHEL